MVKRIDIQTEVVRWDDDQRLIVDGVLFTGEAVMCNWLDEVTSLADYVDGFREGARREWHDGGQLKSDLTVRNGRIVGAARRWDEDGNLVRKHRHDDTALVKLAAGVSWPGGPRRRWCSRPGLCGRRSGAETLRLPSFRRTGMPE
jgi:hypothetical protein